jgi:fermentation-respiration switch protein FrsA (DUF1100 family)
MNFRKSILEINAKILILHAEDDKSIPYSHGLELYEICQNRRYDLPPVRFVSVNKELGLGHFIQSHKPMYEHIK